MKTILITGPMFASKTSRLASMMEKYTLAKRHVVYVTPKKDTREEVSHSKENGSKLTKLLSSKYVSALEAENEDKLFTDLFALRTNQEISAIFIDEFFMVNFTSKFFKNVRCLLPKNGEVVFAGLISDAKNKLFPVAAEILPYMDEIQKEDAVCMECGEPANYSYFIGSDFAKDKGAINIDTGINYVCLCHDCMFKKGNK